MPFVISVMWRFVRPLADRDINPSLDEDSRAEVGKHLDRWGKYLLNQRSGPGTDVHAFSFLPLRSTDELFGVPSDRIPVTWNLYGLGTGSADIIQARPFGLIYVWLKLGTLQFVGVVSESIKPSEWFNTLISPVSGIIRGPFTTVSSIMLEWSILKATAKRDRAMQISKKLWQAIQVKMATRDSQTETIQDIGVRLDNLCFGVEAARTPRS